MKITLKVQYIREFAKKHPFLEDLVNERLYYAREEDGTDIDISHMTDEELLKLQEFIRGLSDKVTTNKALQNISVYLNLRKDPHNVVAPNLEALADALKIYINANSERKWLFKFNKDGIRLPYIVTYIEYSPPVKRGGNYEPAFVSVSLRYIDKDESRTSRINFFSQDLQISENSKKSGNFKMNELLDKKNYAVGTKELCNIYDEEFGVFMKYRDMIGEQFISNGSGFEEDNYSSRYSYDMKSLNTDGTYHKLVVDEPISRKLDTDLYEDSKFWERDGVDIHVPIHLYISMFNLTTHMGYRVYSSTLKPYVYDTKLIDKLILPDEVKELVQILGTGVKENLGDIIDGKARGIIIGCVGPPGTGKTLTAEIYAEFLQRPLYVVQCSQLGTNEEKLEKSLHEVLRRATRWKAILLLDEADVYIRKRGNDIKQNAIVGVFLRVLESYAGILFLTSNLGDIIDDAIESRMSAKVVYDYPSEEASKRIWADQFENHGWKVNNKLIDSIYNEYPNLSGRGIRSLMKLTTLLCRYKNQEIDLASLRHAGKFAVHESKDKVKSKEYDSQKDTNI